MTTNGTASMAVVTHPIVSTPKPAGHSQNITEAHVFADILENSGLPERRSEQVEAVEISHVRRLDLIIGGLSDLQSSADPNEVQQSGPLLALAGRVETGNRSLRQPAEAVAVVLPELPVPFVELVPPAPSVQVVPSQVSMASPMSMRTAPVPPSTPSASSSSALPDLDSRQVLATTSSESAILRLPIRDLARSGTAPEMASQAAGAAQLVGARSPMEKTDGTPPVAGHAVLSARPISGTPLSIRSETYLLPTDGRPAASTLHALAAQSGTHEENGRRSDEPQWAVGVAVEAAPIGPVAGEAETVAVQIAGQISAAWSSSLQGSIPPDAGEGRTPMPAASPLPGVAPDVVKALRFDLHPGDLGEVHVRLSMGRNGLRLHLSFSADKAASIAQAEGEELMQTISAGGMNLGQLVIDTLTPGKAEPLVRQEGSSSDRPTSDGSMADGGGGDGRERQAHREQPRTDPQAERYASLPGIRIGEKTGLFI